MKHALLCALAALVACAPKPREQKAADSAPTPVTADSTPAPVAFDSIIYPIGTELVRIETPVPNSVITSPVTVSGQAKGSYYFEASFPVILLDGNGDTLAVKPAQAQGEWMTENFVPFLVTLDFPPPKTPAGILVLMKDNPSGLAQHNADFRVPVRFTP